MANKIVMATSMMGVWLAVVVKVIIVRELLFKGLHPSPWLCRMWTTRRTPALVLLADVELEDYEVS